MGVIVGFAAPVSLSLTKSNISGTRLGFRRVFVQPARTICVNRVTGKPKVPKMRYSGGGGGRNQAVPPVERILGIAPYLLPLLDALAFGRYVFAAAPAVTTPILRILGPIYAIYRGIPFVAFGVFLALYVLVVRNVNVSRFIRFNTLQALMIDIAYVEHHFSRRILTNLMLMLMNIG